MSVNIQIIEGYLGQDPEYKMVGDTALCTISVATTEKWKGKDGGMHEKTEWFEVNFWGKDAENIKKFFSKGKGIFVMGRTETRTYEDKEGVKRWRTSVRADRWTFPSGGGGTGNKEDKPAVDDGPPPGGSTDDIPF